MIHVIIGNQGSGKTLLMCKLAYFMLKQKKNIFANISFNFKYDPIKYQDIIDCAYSDASVFIDEAHLLLSNRRSMSKVNIEITNSFISQVRKQNLELYLSTQRFLKLDIKVRDETDYLYECKKLIFENGVFKTSSINLNLDKKVPIVVSVKITELSTMESKDISFIGNPYFDLYNTKEIVKIEGLENE
jgi:hypothetical protein